MRGRRAATGGICALALALPAAAIADGPATYQADPAHSGHAAGTTFAPPLGKRWIRRDLGEGLSFPVIAEGKAFVASEASVYALDLGSGQTVWSRPIKTAGVAYDNGRVFAVDGNGVMQALSAANGEKAWSAELPGSLSYFSAPTAYGNYVYASSDSTVFGVRQADGIVVWATDAASAETAIPAVDPDKTYTTAGCGETSALQRTIGAEIWRYSGDCTGGGGATVALHGDRVYATSADTVIVLDALTGMLADSVAGYGPPAFAGDLGYYRGRDELFARSETSGLVQWRAPVDDSIATPPLVAGEFVYAVDGNGTVIGLSRTSGQRVWERELRGSSYYYSSSGTPSGLAAAGDTLLVASGDRLTAFAPGPDTPGVDDPDKPSASGGSLTLEASAKRTVFGRGLLMTGRLEATRTETPVEIQADPWPYGAWEHRRNITPDSSFQFRVHPDRNTRYRAVYNGTNPGLTSQELTVFSDVRLAFRVFGRGRHRVLVKVSAHGPADAGLRRRRVFVYHYRQRARFARRIGALRLRGKGTTARAARVLRTPALHSRDLFFICRREARDDGFGRPNSRLGECGRKRLR